MLSKVRQRPELSSHLLDGVTDEKQKAVEEMDFSESARLRIEISRLQPTEKHKVWPRSRYSAWYSGKSNKAVDALGTTLGALHAVRDEISIFNVHIYRWFCIGSTSRSIQKAADGTETQNIRARAGQQSTNRFLSATR
jgi:hypothetical protein